MRFVYSLITLLFLPMAFGHLLQRSRHQPAYRRHWGERLGLAPRLHGPVIWLHAVSVGETRAAAPLLEALLQRYPDHSVLLTHTTPTGRATGRELFGAFGDRVVQAYLPYDLPWAVTAFLRRTRPRLGLLMETEIWPNLYAAAARRGIPLFLVNARMSEKSAAGYARLGRLTPRTLNHLTAIAAQTEADAARLAALGATHISVCGNLKFDVAPPADNAARTAELRALFGPRPVWIAASTRESGGASEEAMIVAAWLQKMERMGSDSIFFPLLVLVPRHPQRFEQVAALLTAHGVRFLRRSEGKAADATTQVVLGDSMGEMAAYYGAADLAFIGGSLLPLGGQNLIEAASAGCPVLIGPHSFNFAAVSEAALAAGAAVRVADAEALVHEVMTLFAAPERRTAMRAAGQAFTAQQRGATARTLALLKTVLG